MDTWNPAPDQQEEIPWNYKNYGTVLDQSDDLNIKETISTREEGATSIPASERDGLIAGGRNSESAGRQKSMQAQTDRQLELAASKMTKGEMGWRLGHLSLSPLLSLLSSFFPLSLRPKGLLDCRACSQTISTIDISLSPVFFQVHLLVYEETNKKLIKKALSSVKLIQRSSMQSWQK